MNAKPQKELIYSELTFKIIELAFEVHNQLGPGFSEEIYEKAMICEFRRNNIPFEQQRPIEVCYKGELLGIYRLDLVVDDKVILELKAVSAINDIHKQQLLSYLKATHLRLGLLINFGSKRVEHQRVIN